MSTENVDRVRAAIDALNGSGWDPDAVIPHFDPGAVHYPFPDWPGLERYEGPEGLRALIDEWTQSFDELHWEVVRLIDEEDRVVARIQPVGRRGQLPHAGAVRAHEEQLVQAGRRHRERDPSSVRRPHRVPDVATRADRSES